MIDQLYSTADVARILKHTPVYVWKRIQAGEIAVINTGTERKPVYRITPEAVQAFLDSRRGVAVRT